MSNPHGRGPAASKRETPHLDTVVLMGPKYPVHLSTRRDAMRRTLLHRSFVMTLLVLVGGAAFVSAMMAEDKALLHLHAVAVDLGGRARLGILEIVVERWATEEEREQLRATLIEKGSEALRAALQKIKPRAGYIQTPTSLGWDIQYAREEPFGDGGRRIVLATDRPMSFGEMERGGFRAEYEFTFAEIRLTKGGKGVGKLVSPAKISWNQDTRTAEIKNYNLEPVRLTEVEVVTTK
jgi:hypothetical protein